MSERKEERTDIYWICDECLRLKGLVPKATAGDKLLMGLCGWCRRLDKTLLTPRTDLRYKDEPDDTPAKR